MYIALTNNGGIDVAAKQMQTLMKNKMSPNSYRAPFTIVVLKKRNIIGRIILAA